MRRDHRDLFRAVEETRYRIASGQRIHPATGRRLRLAEIDQEVAISPTEQIWVRVAEWSIATPNLRTVSWWFGILIGRFLRSRSQVKAYLRGRADGKLAGLGTRKYRPAKDDPGESVEKEVGA